MAKDNWTREQTIVAFNVYCKVPFKKSSSRHPIVIKYADIIGRSPSALNMKIGNLGRLDPALRKKGIVGLSNGSKLEEIIWNEFHGNWSNLAYESELLISKFQNKTIEESAEIDIKEIPPGIDRQRVVKTRVNQNFFRATVLSSYNQECCVTGLSITELLVASHIIPWSRNKLERLNPKNGLCLNALHDKAFDRGLFTISPENKIILSKYITDFEKEDSIRDFFLTFENKRISLPDRFVPEPAFLKYHYENIFKK